MQPGGLCSLIDARELCIPLNFYTPVSYSFFLRKLPLSKLLIFQDLVKKRASFPFIQLYCSLYSYHTLFWSSLLAITICILISIFKIFISWFYICCKFHIASGFYPVFFFFTTFFLFRHNGTGQSLLRALSQAQQWQVSDEVRHARGAGAAALHRHAGDHQDQKARLPCEVNANFRLVKGMQSWNLEVMQMILYSLKAQQKCIDYEKVILSL